MSHVFKPNSPAANATAKKKLYPIAKMKPSGRARHMANMRTMINTPLRAKQPFRREPEASGSRSGGNAIPQLTVQKFKGTLAPYNDHANWVQDPFNSKVYMIGGIRPFDRNWEPTSDFFCYDTRTMKWEDLTDSFTFREPYDPYSRTELQREKKPLPQHSQPGCTLWRHKDTSFIFFFGGCDPETTDPTSQVVIINLQAREWWYERFDRDPLPRIAPAIVAIQNRVYIFGGYRSYEEDSQACCSYSIAEWNESPQGNRWSWVNIDTPYPPPLSPTTCVAQAISVYEGKVIFLAPGRTNSCDDREIHFADKNLFYFRLRDQAFLPVPIIGDPPRNIQWYSIFDMQSVFDHIPSPPNPASANSVPAPPKKRGRPRKFPDADAPPAAAIIPKPSTSLQKPPPSILICAWLDQPSNGDSEQESADEENTSPEIYRFDFHPEDICKSLNVKAKISSLNRDFQGSAYVTPGYLCLLGNHQADEPKFNVPMETGYSDSDDEVSRTWNIYLNVPIDV